MKTAKSLAGAVLIAILLDQSCLAAESPASDFFTRLGESNLSLHKTLLGAGASQGASFSYANAAGQPEQFTSQFALQYTPYFPNRHFVFDSSVAANLSSQDDKKTTFLNLRAQLGYWHVLDDARPYDGFSFYLRTGPLFENSADFNVKNLLLEAEFAPFNRALALQVIREITPGLAISFAPILTLQVGTSLSGRAETQELEQTRLRLIPRLGATLYFTGLASLLGLNGVSLSADDQLVYLPLEEEATHNFLDVSLTFQMTKDISFGPSWQTGKVAPYFKQASIFKLQLNVKFGDNPWAPQFPATEDRSSRTIWAGLRRNRNGWMELKGTEASRCG